MIKNEVKDLEYCWNNRILTKYRRKIFKTSDRRIVIEIEQKPISQGTTITNTIELIARSTIENLRNECLRKSKFDYLKTFINLIPFGIIDLLKIILLEIVNRIEVKNNLNSIIWIEHYPANVYFFTEDRYAIVTFEKNYINPDWLHYTKEEISKQIKCDINQL